MTDDLVAFLRARLDEDERTAREAATTAAAAIGEHVHKIGAADGRPYDGTWWDNDYDHVFARDPRPGRKLQGMVADCGYGALGLTTHIARHDPARVLREVGAKRRVLSKHNVPAVVLPGFGSRDDDRRCVGCGFGSDEEPRAEDVNECPTLRALATAYADHPDYRAEWRP